MGAGGGESTVIFATTEMEEIGTPWQLINYHIMTGSQAGCVMFKGGLPDWENLQENAKVKDETDHEKGQKAIRTKTIKAAKKIYVQDQV